MGSGCNDFPAYDRAITTAKRLFEFGSLLGYNMNLLDIGGGFPGSDNKKFATVSQTYKTYEDQPNYLLLIIRFSN